MPRTSTQPQRAGFSLVEALIVVVVMGFLLAISVPRITNTVASTNVRSAKSAVANMYARARITAVQRRKPATLLFTGGRVWVTVPRGGGGGAVDTIGGVTDLTAQYGVTVTSTGNVTVLPTGLVNGAASKVVVTKGYFADSVMISGYGRVQ